jgi:Tol biopolymer transport system component/putative hemolysin
MFSVLLLVGVVLVGCGVTSAPAPTATPVATVAPAATAPQETYTDPFAYCAAVGTIDSPGADYVGPKVPEAVLQGLQQALNAPDTPTDLLERGSFWRCMDGNVYACFVGANLPCEAKANTDQTPTQEEIDYCQQNPSSDFIPAAVTGRETVYEWRCVDGVPEIVQQVSQPDARGFLSEIWYKLGSTEATPGMPNPASQFCVEQGYQSEIRDESDGQVGYCLFPDGSECEEWAFYRGECAPASEGQATPGSIIQPLIEEVCNGQAQAMSHTLDDLIPTQSEEPLDDWVTGATGIGCQATITGTGVQFESPAAVVNALGIMLGEQGWTADPMLVADGPTGTAAGYRKGDQICLIAAAWEPDDSANCPQDQPISACEVTPEQQNYTVTLNCGVTTAEGQTSDDAGSVQLVFDSTRGGDYRDLYVMNAEGSDLNRLTEGEANSLAGPWSPDGTRIVYTAFGLTTSDIMVMNADGSGLVNLTNTPDIDEGFPSWSPDGMHIAFTSRRDGNNEIYVMNADGTNPSRWTDNPADDFAPAWSPDGTKIVFVSDRDREAGIYDLYIMDVVSTEVTRLTNDEAIDYAPAWSPDGTQIAFRSHHDGPADIYVINVDGTGLTDLTNSPADDWAPTWSPDGMQIAFQTNRDGNWEIYVMNADGTVPTNLTQNPADDQLPFWGR